MTIIDDGVIKFNFSEFVEIESLPTDEYLCLEEQRKKLFSLNLIGEYLPERIGFGNISIKKDYSEFKNTNFPQFLISGTQTGGQKDLDGSGYTRVIDGNLDEQSVACHGPIKASSESLTHAAIYLSCPQVTAIVHVHHRELWNKMLKGEYDKTSADVPYGTTEMANEVLEIAKGKTSGTLVMQGHQDGIIFFSDSIEEATSMAIKTLNKEL